jgi:signal transduction histidine kinase
VKNGFLYIAMGLSLVVLVWLGRIYLLQNRLQMQYTTEVDRTYQVIITLRNLEQLLADAETSQRGYLLTRNDHFKTPYAEAIPQIDSVLQHLKDIIADNPKQRVYLKLLEPAVRQREAMMQQNMDEKDKEGLRQQLRAGKLVMDKIRLYVETMEEEEYALLAYRDKEKNRYQDLNLSFLKYAFSFAGLIFICSIALIIRELRMRIRTQKMLEKTVFELTRSNEEIEQVSFAASHDLQEPLRKIRTLSNLLATKYAPGLPDEERDIIERIERSSERMHGLLKNLIDFTNLVTNPEKIGSVDLDHQFMDAFNHTMRGVPVTLYKEIQLPVIQGHRQQVALLFTQLLSNSLKYHQPERELTIEVQYTLMETAGTLLQKGKQYHEITIRDNGIGFDNAFREKIFVIFQRLHNKGEYEGQGIGLTIARRIMANHYGFIEADGHSGKGASFTLYFPVS